MWEWVEPPVFVVVVLIGGGGVSVVVIVVVVFIVVAVDSVVDGGVAVLVYDVVCVRWRAMRAVIALRAVCSPFHSRPRAHKWHVTGLPTNIAAPTRYWHYKVAAIVPSLSGHT